MFVETLKQVLISYTQLPLITMYLLHLQCFLSYSWQLQARNEGKWNWLTPVNCLAWSTSQYKIRSWGRGDGSVSRVLVSQAWGLEFYKPESMKTSLAWHHALVISGLWRQRWDDPWVLLASQSTCDDLYILGPGSVTIWRCVPVGISVSWL
jgi:hypothetical protein